MSDISRIDNTDLEAVITIADDMYGRKFIKTEPRCFTCNSPYRAFIEEWYVLGHSPSDIIERIETREGEGVVGLTPQLMHTHFQKGHCTNEQALRMQSAWKKAHELGVDPQSYDDAMTLSVLVTELTVRKFQKRLLEDAFNPDFKEGLAAAKLLYEMEKINGEQSEFDPQDLFIAISIFMSHVSAVLSRFAPAQTKEAMAWFSNRLEADPILKDLIEKTREETVGFDDFAEGFDPDIQDAEIVTVSDVQVAMSPDMMYDATSDDGEDDPWIAPED